MEQSGGGLVTSRTTEVIVSGCTFSENSAQKWGGGVFIESDEGEESAIDIYDSTITSNTARYVSHHIIPSALTRTSYPDTTYMHSKHAHVLFLGSAAEGFISMDEEVQKHVYMCAPPSPCLATLRVQKARLEAMEPEQR